MDTNQTAVKTNTNNTGVGGFKPGFQGARKPFGNNSSQGGRSFGGGKFSGRRPSGGRPGAPFVKPDIDYKIMNIRRVARITKGGKRFTFSVALVCGDKKGSVGIGTGKAGDTASAIDKALKNGKKNMFKVKTTKDMSIPHESSAKYASSRITIRPAVGRGLVAGSSARLVFSLAGITDVSSKFYSRTKNPLNNAQATVAALKNL